MKEALMQMINEINAGLKIAENKALKEALAQPVPFGHWHWEQPMTKPLQGWFVKGPSDGKLNGVAGIALYTAPLLPEQEPVAVYGYCPKCGAKGVQRERRPDGNDKCVNGHTYPSSKATPPKRPWVGLTADERDALRAEVERLKAAVAGERRALIHYFADHWRSDWSDGQIIEAIEARGNT